MTMKEKLAVVVMAAGMGKRMKSDLPKALLPVGGKPMLGHILQTARSLNPEKIVVVVGHKREMVIETFAAPDVGFAVQDPQLGTAHAVAQAEEALAGFMGVVAVLSADAPLITRQTLERLIESRAKKNAAVAALTVELDNPASYGRILRENGKITGNVEAKDATSAQLEINEINSGVYVFDSGFLFGALKKVDRNNAQGEYYLTDLINMAARAGLPIAGIKTADPSEALGANTAEDLDILDKILAARR
ncbi:MAG: NTP transferase domain-containing protein [Nitrospinae bacterium]|nr:NTP transferase domain-containing protein [Nitrospinota bacterium]